MVILYGIYLTLRNLQIKSHNNTINLNEKTNIIGNFTSIKSCQATTLNSNFYFLLPQIDIFSQKHNGKTLTTET